MRHEDKKCGARRLFQCLEQTVRRHLVHAVSPVDHNDPAAGAHGRTGGGNEDVAHGIGADHRRTLAACLGCCFKIIRMHARRHRAARVTAPTGCIARCFAKQCAREHACRTAFADALHAGKEQRVGQALRRRQYAQTADDLRMPMNVRPILWERLPRRFITDSSRRCLFCPRHYI